MINSGSFTRITLFVVGEGFTSAVIECFRPDRETVTDQVEEQILAEVKKAIDRRLFVLRQKSRREK